MRRLILWTLTIVVTGGIGAQAQSNTPQGVSTNQHLAGTPAKKDGPTVQPKEIARLLEVLQSTEADKTLAASSGSFQARVDHAAKVAGDITWAAYDVNHAGLATQAQEAVIALIKVKQKSASTADRVAIKRGLGALASFKPLLPPARDCVAQLARSNDEEIRKRAIDLLKE